MALYQISATFTAIASAVLFVMAARHTRDRLIRYMQYLWALVMIVAATSYLLMYFTDLDAQLVVIGRSFTPIGWGALAVIAARRYAHRNE